MLRFGQKRIHAGKIQARSFACAAGFDIAAVVFHENGIAIEPIETEIAQQVRQAIGAQFESGVCHGLTRARHDKRGL